MDRKAYSTDVSDEEWAFVMPYLALMSKDVSPQEHSLREVFNGLRWLIQAGGVWRLMPHDLPPWAEVYQQTQQWCKVGVFEAIVDDLGVLLSATAERTQPTAVMMDRRRRPLQSMTQCWQRAGYNGDKHQKESTVQLASDALGHWLGLVVTPTDRQDKAHVQALAQHMQQITGETVVLTLVEQGYMGEQPAQNVASEDMQLTAMKLSGTRTGFVFLPRRWVVERSFAWAGRLRRLARDYEHLAKTLVGFKMVASAV